MRGEIGRWRLPAAYAAGGTVFGVVAVDEIAELGLERKAFDIGIVGAVVAGGNLHDKGVENIVVLGDVGAGRENIELVMAENAAQAGE